MLNQGRRQAITMKARTILRHAGAMLAGVLATAVVASVVQTQINLLSITAMGVPVPATLRLATIGEDILRFGPVMALIAGAAFVPAFVVAALTDRFAGGHRLLVRALAGMAGLWTAFMVMSFFTPMPTLVAAVRTPPGLAAMCLTGLLGGAVYGALTAGRSRRSGPEAAAR
jgi:hypothetical protein